MFRARPILLITAVLLLAACWLFWRNSQVVLTDEQQIANILKDLQQAAQNQSSAGVASYLAEDFSWDGQSKSELRSQMNGAFIQFRDVTANISGTIISVQGDKATANGNYVFAYRPAPRADFESHRGQFRLQLAKRDGKWLIVKAEEVAGGGQRDASEGL